MDGTSTEGDSEEEENELDAGEEEQQNSEKHSTTLNCTRCCRCCSKVTSLGIVSLVIVTASLFIQNQKENLVDVVAIIDNFRSTFTQAHSPELFGDDDLCTMPLPLEGVVLVAVPMNVAIAVVIVWVLWPVRQTTLEDIRKKHRLEDVTKEKERAEKTLSLIDVEITLKKSNGHHKEKHSDDDMDSDRDNFDEMFYQRPVPILELGSRLQKYWSLDENKTSITSVAKKSQLCYLTKEGFNEVNEFLKSLDYPHVQKIFSVRLDDSEGDSQVIVSQPLWRRGSLRDLINRVNDPFADWAEKYTADSGRPLATETVAKYGSQILQAMLYLYKQKFFHNKLMCPLGQVQSGNIFIMDDDNCVLGGHENVLLNYRTSLYSTIAHYNLLDYIDIIMFGNVVYEMCAGHSLKNIVPSEEEYDKIEDEMCLEVLRYIFTRDRNGHLSRTIKKISKHKFFLERMIRQETEKASEFEGIFGVMSQTKAKMTKSAGISSAGGISESTAISGGTDTMPDAMVTQNLKNAFLPQLSIDDDSSRRSRSRSTAGSFSKNIKGGWKQTKSMGRSFVRSVSPPRWRKSDHRSLEEQDPSSDSEISDSTAEAQESHPHQRRRALSWSSLSFTPHDIKKKDEAATGDTESSTLHMKQQTTLSQPIKDRMYEKRN